MTARQLRRAAALLDQYAEEIRVIDPRTLEASIRMAREARGSAIHLRRLAEGLRGAAKGNEPMELRDPKAYERSEMRKILDEQAKGPR